MLRKILPVLTLGATLYTVAQTSTPVTLQLQQVASGLSNIVDISHCGDDRLFVTLRTGQIKIVEANNQVLATPFLNITSEVLSSYNEQGLLGLAFSPNYQTDSLFYVYYITGTGNGVSRVSRFHVTDDPNVADPASEEIIYTWVQPAVNHNGGDLNFGPDGMLYVGFGDGGSQGDPNANGQDFTDPLGNIIRIDVSDPDTTYTIPPDNWYANATDTLPELWAWGLRNPWRWYFDPTNGDLWIGDVGQNLWEEVDYRAAGEATIPNYGWRCYEGLVAYNTAGCQGQSFYDQPVSVHAHSASPTWCSVIGGRRYHGDTYWRIDNRYIYTDYCAGQFFSLQDDGNGGWTRTLLLSSGQQGFSCVGENSALELYAGNTSNGTLWKLKEICTDTIPVVTAAGDSLTSTPANSYQWYMNGTSISGATEQSYTPTVSGNYAVLANFGGGCQLASEAQWFSPVGVAEIEHGVLVRPIPANDVLRIDGLTTTREIALLDAAGRVQVSMGLSQGGSMTLPVRDLANGIYSLVARDAKGTVVLRRQVVIQH